MSWELRAPEPCAWGLILHPINMSDQQLLQHPEWHIVDVSSHLWYILGWIRNKENSWAKFRVTRTAEQKVCGDIKVVGCEYSPIESPKQRIRHRRTLCALVLHYYGFENIIINDFKMAWPHLAIFFVTRPLPSSVMGTSLFSFPDLFFATGFPVDF